MSFRSVLSEPKSVHVVFDQPSKTKQSFKNECDINLIMKKFAKTGLVSHVQSSEASYGDVSMLGDYQSSLNVVMSAQNAFLGLSAQVRRRFDNDPALFLEFVQDPKNRDEAIALNLINIPEKISQPAAVDVGSEAPAKT